MVKGQFKDRARVLDEADELKEFKGEFIFPEAPPGITPLYFVGNSLGLQPKSTRAAVTEVLEDWAKFGVEGHFEARHPWFPYHEFLTQNMADLVGARPSEVVVMNSLTVNLHLMMVSFYRPTAERFKILIERDAFPSDRYAVNSQIRSHGFDPRDALIVVGGESDQNLKPISMATWEEAIKKHGPETALVLTGQVNYLTGQAFNLKKLAALSHAQGALFAADLAHGVGNLELKLHDDEVDFGVWCGYKYLNGGPGALAGAFVHERHHSTFSKSESPPRFEGWWGTQAKTRFLMRDPIEPILGAEGWQLSNPPILSMAALRSSLEVFARAKIGRLRAKSVRLTAFLEEALRSLSAFEILTPSNPEERGCQLSVRVFGEKDPKAFSARLVKRGVYCDFRSPDVLRFSPAPLYTSFKDVADLAQILNEELSPEK